MNGYEQILVVILSTFLAIFLLLGIILLIFLIKLMRTVQRVTEKAEQLADKAGAVGDFFKNASAPLALARTISLVTDTIFKRNKSSKDTSNRKG